MMSLSCGRRVPKFPGTFEGPSCKQEDQVLIHDVARRLSWFILLSSIARIRHHLQLIDWLIDWYLTSQINYRYERHLVLSHPTSCCIHRATTSTVQLHPSLRQHILWATTSNKRVGKYKAFTRLSSRPPWRQTRRFLDDVLEILLNSLSSIFFIQLLVVVVGRKKQKMQKRKKAINAHVRLPVN